MVLLVNVLRKDWFYNTGTIFTFVFFEVKKMKSRKFEIICICLCSLQSSVLNADILNNGTQSPAEKSNVWHLKKMKYIL